MNKTTLSEVEFAEETKELIALNEDVECSEELREKINGIPNAELILVKKSIGSHPVKIESAEVYDEKFFLENF
jgi:hypothetical protein